MAQQNSIRHFHCTFKFIIPRIPKDKDITGSNPGSDEISHFSVNCHTEQINISGFIRYEGEYWIDHFLNLHDHKSGCFTFCFEPFINGNDCGYFFSDCDCDGKYQ